jgi:hypothetical protein
VGKTTFIGATSPTGQVDGDIWIDQDTTTNAVVPTALTTKGDMFAATGNAAYTRFAAGNNGESLYADSTTSTGLRWQGDFNTGKNKIINGDFSIWQRGTSFTTGSYSADRWLVETDSTFTISRQAFTLGSAPVAGYEASSFLRLAKNAGGSYVILAQRIEDVRSFANQTVTVSFWAKADSNVTGSFFINQVFGTGGSANQNYGYSPGWAITTNWQRFTYTFTVPSIATYTIGTGSFVQFQFARVLDALSHTIDIWGVQVESGSVATPFTTNTANPQAELAACQRYYYRHAVGSMQPVSLAFYWSATQLQTTIPFPVTMRAAPTLDATSGASYYRIGRNSTSQDINGFALSIASQNAADIYNNGQASGTAGWAGTLYTINASSYIGFAAEL